MPNGFKGSKEDWGRMMSPLLAIDSTWREFARKKGLDLDGHRQNWPARSLSWARDFKRRISLSLTDRQEPVYDLRVMAWQDEGDLRFGKTEVIETGLSAEELPDRIPNLLDEAFAAVDSWNREDLVDQTGLARIE